MDHPVHVALARKLLAQIGGEASPHARVGEVPSAHYTSTDRFELERAAIFRKFPQIVAMDAELESGGSLAVEIGGVPILVVRGDDGVVRAFKNACRHRGTQLVPDDAPCKRKAFVCPYHGWTYDLAGRLLHAPHVESFEGRDASRSELVAVFAAVRHGFVWVGLTPFDLDACLAPIADELATLDAGALVPFQRSVREVRGNWKLVVDAFLDGYHIRQLHRGTIYRFFLDARSEAESAGLHVRAATARRALAEVGARGLVDAKLRDLVTPSYLVFPNVILILHPDYLSVLVATPRSASTTRFVHWMLIPNTQAPKTPAEQEHWAKSFTLIDEGVFAKEDLAVVEAMQVGLGSGANETVLFGTLEFAALWFHESLDQVIRSATNP